MQLPPAIIDIEASGFGRGSYPVEIGLALPDGSLHCYLVKPQPEWTHWDPKAEQIHGISRDTLQQHGHSVAEIAKLLNQMLIGMTLYSDAWGMDMPWIGKLFDALDMLPRFRIEALSTLLKPHLLSQWHAIKQQVIDHHRLDRHRASHDALILQQTYVQLTQADVTA